MKVRVLVNCPQCQGQAYVPVGEAINTRGEKYLRHVPCSRCEGTGEAGVWIELEEFGVLLKQAACSHEHVSTRGGFHLSAGDVWDDVEEVCSDCGKEMR